MLKRYTKTCIEGVGYDGGRLSTILTVTGPTRRLGHGGVDAFAFIEQARFHCDDCIFLDKTSVLHADTALLETLNKLFDKRYTFVDTPLRYECVRLTKYSWAEQEFDSCWIEGTTPLNVINFKLSKEYGLRWSPACGQDMPEELTKLSNELEPVFPKMIE
jgi:hypothetical protein